jgi:hypothetical protein
MLRSVGMARGVAGRHFRKIVLTPFLLLLGGCAALECDTDWYETGRRDGRLGAEAQAEYYVGRCGAEVDVMRYHDGWYAGAAMRPRVAAP